jgi:osmotically-inducible protein OsmY
VQGFKFDNVETILMPLKRIFVALALVCLAAGVACNSNRKVTNLDPEVVKNAEKQAGYDSLSVDVNKDKGVVTLSGRVPSEQDKDRAGQVAQAVAGQLVVANQISIEPPGVASQAREIEGNIDDSIEKQFKALLIANHWDKEHIAYKSKNGVLTLRGRVPDMQDRADVEKVAATVPHVTQVVNELDVKGK